MPEIQPYKPTERRGETFSYLPPMTPEKVRKQIAYLVSQGWNPAIEHTEPEKAFSHYWYLWKLPFFGETSVEKIMAELEACHRANPGHLVRLIGYDNYAQSQGTAFIVYRGGR
ncbi:ribulose bisphosphate carboxylase small subunit [Pelomicrobium sp.]|jgi:ribulose-bisphosphate carboxylase small chain|uniref:ribulose bisphosphate carboxylase small subunit n=1 Tax=Pelomicrobium sp. TaxID=2815319 RepID=UPI002FDE8639